MEYVVMVLCFVGILLLKGFLIKKSYGRKMNFYSDPDELAKEIKGNKHSSDFQFKDNETLKKFIQFNVNMYKNVSIQDPMLKRDMIDILRKVSLVIALVNQHYDDNKAELVNKLKIISYPIFPVNSI